VSPWSPTGHCSLVNQPVRFTTPAYERGSSRVSTRSLPVGARPAARYRQAALGLFAITALAVAVRLILLPYASQDTNDHTGRIFIAWRWAEDPFLFLHGGDIGLDVPFGAAARFLGSRFRALMALDEAASALSPAL
jgi:hypothetical protein